MPSARLPHISHPLTDARRLINDANHHAYRAGDLDTAYEIARAIAKLEAATVMLKAVQMQYPVANPATIDLSRPPSDPALAPGEPDHA